MNQNTNKTESLLKFPCDIGIKAMGLATDEFRSAVLTIIDTHCEACDQLSVKSRSSNAGKYLSITTTIRATRREQLEKIYFALSENPYVIMAL